MVKYVVQIVFLIWSILLYLIFLHAGYKLIHLLQTVPNSMLMRDSNTHQKGLFIHIIFNLFIIINYYKTMDIKKSY